MIRVSPLPIVNMLGIIALVNEDGGPAPERTHAPRCIQGSSP